MELTYLIPVVVAAIAAGGAFLIARRTGSGTIKTSQASDLWTESQQMRSALRDEVTELRSQLRDALSDVTRLQTKIGVLEAQIGSLLIRLADG